MLPKELGNIGDRREKMMRDCGVWSDDAGAGRSSVGERLLLS